MRLIIVTTAVLVLGSIAAMAAVWQERSRPPGAEAISLFGEPLVPPAPSAERRAALEKDLADAQAMLDRAPGDPEAIIWVGRRLAYLGRYQEAIDTFSRGIDEHPEYFKLYRHRGHRYITVRKFDRAIADLSKAASLIQGVPDEIEPDGAPNERNIPVSTSHTNIYYHLALAHYLTGDFERALEAQQACLEFSKNPDMQVATRYWLYLTLRRLGRDAEAKAALEPVTAGMDVIENGAYHRLLLTYKGEVTPDAMLEQAAQGGIGQPTSGYGVAAWHLVNGRRAEAIDGFRQILRSPQWAAFGYIAAEADLHREGLEP